MGRVGALLVVAAFGQADSATAGMTVGAAAWNDPRVEVCFASKRQTELSRFGEDSKTFPTRAKVVDATEEERTLIESTIRSEYREADTGIEFAGFQPCVPGGTAKIFIYVGSGGPLGAGNIGERMQIEKFWTYTDREGRQVISPVYAKLETALPSYLYFQNLKALKTESGRLSPADRLRLNALHEFGHAAGLAHEDERAETDQSPNCHYQRARSAYRVSEPRTLTAYDPASVMSYCFVGVLLEKTGLHYQVARPGRDPASLPTEGLPLLRWPGLHLEDSLRTLENTEKADRFDVRIRLGLSGKDRLSLRCLYRGENCPATRR